MSIKNCVEGNLGGLDFKARSAEHHCPFGAADPHGTGRDLSEGGTAKAPPGTLPNRCGK